MSEARALIKAEVKEIKDAAKIKGSLIHDIDLDENNLMFLLGKGDDEINATIIIPENYPRGIYQVLDMKGMHEVGRGTIRSIMDKVIVEFAAEHDIAAPLPRFENKDDLPSVADVPKVERQMSTLSVDEDGDGFIGGDSMVLAKPIDDACSALQSVYGVQAAGIMIQGSGDHYLRFRYDVSSVDDDTAVLWGMTPGVPIIIEFQFLAPHFLASTRKPQIEIYQVMIEDLAISHSSDKMKLALAWQLHQRLLERLEWPIKGSPTDYFVSLYHYMQDKIMTCTKSCVICDSDLGYTGLKPAVCSNPLCCYSYMQYGLGEDIASFIHRNPEVTDLLISLTGSAAQGDGRRFNPFPNGVEGKIYSESKKESTTVGFTLKGDKPDLHKVLEVLNRIPSVEDMLAFETTDELKERLDQIDVLCFPLLRWIITSNRTHLQLIPKDSQIKAMNTKYQFILRSSTPEKEKKFQEDKVVHGSFYAFHGSGLGNWHSILRVGLKNLSGTDLMSTGAAYGNGIYMAPNSSTSLGYAPGGAVPWKNSSITGSSCVALAICEVINAGYTANPHYVVPEESHVNTRFFFMYTTSPGLSIDASSLKIPDTATLKPVSASTTSGTGGPVKQRKKKK